MESLLLALSSTLTGSSRGIGLSSSLRLVLFRDGKSLAILSEFIEHVAALSAGVSVGMISHVGSGRALFALNLELNDLSSVVNVEVLEDSLGSLLVLVADLLGLGVDLLLSLLLTTAQAEDHVDCGL